MEEEVELDHGRPSMPQSGFRFHFAEKSPVSKDRSCSTRSSKFRKHNEGLRLMQ